MYMVFYFVIEFEQEVNSVSYCLYVYNEYWTDSTSLWTVILSPSHQKRNQKKSSAFVAVYFMQFISINIFCMYLFVVSFIL